MKVTDFRVDDVVRWKFTPDAEDSAISDYIGIVVEAGDEFITVNWKIDGPNDKYECAYRWDVHLGGIDHIILDKREENTVTVNVDLNEVETLKNEVASLRDTNARLLSTNADQQDRINRLTASGGRAAAEHIAFQEKVFNYLKDDLDLDSDDLRSAAESLDIEEYLDEEFEIVVTLRFSADDVRSEGIRKRDELDDEKVAELIYGATRQDLYYRVEEFETPDA